LGNSAYVLFYHQHYVVLISGSLTKSGESSINCFMRILSYLIGVFAIFLALCSALIAAPVDVQAQGCAGGACGITTTVSPNSGPTGTQVTLSISSGAYPLGGNYAIWWSKTPNMSGNAQSSDPDQQGDPTAVKLAEGSNPKLSQNFNVSLSVPEACNGTNYFHFIRSGKAEQMMNFAFQVTPTLIARDDKVKPRSSINVTGTGFPPSDKISLYVDGEPVEVSAETNTTGSFSADLPLPDLIAGTHVVKATAKKMYNQEATLKVKVVPAIMIEPALPLVGKTATITGYGFAASSEVSIKYDTVSITSSPTSDKNGRFVYNFTVPETSGGTHDITASDKSGNVAVYQMPVESSPPTTPTPVNPTSDRFGIMGTQPVIFNWMPAKDDSGTVVYTLEIADNLNFFPLMPGMRRSGISETSATMTLEPGTYYWRIQAADPSGNKSKWALSPYAFQVGLINVWLIVGAGIVLLVIFIFLLRAFIQRVRGYYY